MPPRLGFETSSKWFRQELDGSGLHRAHGHGHVAMTGDEDDRHIGPVGEPLLQLQAGEPRQGHIEHQTAGLSNAVA
jgi:hypothetical protein